jgi:hypothetical protein
MAKFLIRWLPFLVLLGIFAVFKSYSIANRYYPAFLSFMTASGFLLVLIYKFIIKTNRVTESDTNSRQ